MYRIIHTLGVHQAILADARRKSTAAWDAVLQIADNDSGQLQFSIAPEHPEYAGLTTLRSECAVEYEGGVLWEGRITVQEADALGRKKVTVKGLLDYLHDSIMEPFGFSGTRTELLAYIVSRHNESPCRANAHSLMAVGTVTDDGTELSFDTSVPMRSWKVLAEAVNSFGGLIRADREDGLIHISWKSESDRSMNSQVLRLGRNVKALRIRDDGQQLATILYGYGKKISGEYVKISSINDGVPYVEDVDASAAFGPIADAYINSDCATPEQLLAATEEELARRLQAYRSIEAEAMDYYDFGQAYEPLDCGQNILLQAEIYGISEAVPITKISRSLFSPVNTKITVGGSFAAASRIILTRRT